MINLSYLGERSKLRENERASERETMPPPLACLSRVYFSRYPPNGQLSRRLRTRLSLKQGTMYIHADVKLVRKSKEVKPYPPPKRQPLLGLFRSHPLIPLKSFGSREANSCESVHSFIPGLDCSNVG